MQSHFGDPDVFIRSLATRGALGGLSRSAVDVTRVLDAWGADVILIETVGVGQDELEITRMADTTLVVAAPGMGDDVQAIKAGILECADVFAVNKADRDGADAAVRDLELMIALGGEVATAARRPRGHSAALFHARSADDGGHERDPGKSPWVQKIVRTTATRNEGVAALIAKLREHHAWLLGTEAGAARRQERLQAAMHVQLRDALVEAAVMALGPAIEAAARAVARREIDPYSAAEQLVQAFQTGAGVRSP
jgi:LAO/AO transport system kinase